MSNGGHVEGSSSPLRSSPIPRGPSTPTSTSPLSDAPRGGQSILAGRYTIGIELGRGSNGRVFKAFDQEDGRFVAVKQISLERVSKEQLHGVTGEIELLKNLDHKNIVQYYGSILTNNHLYIILEYMESGSLAGVIKQTNFGAFSERWVALYVAQVLSGLKYLHAQGVVHRDIKGANILTTKDMVIKLADFGVAAKLADRGSKGSEEETGDNVAGSPYWMAPEVIELSSVTTAADIWSIGCLIVELLTGSAPYFECQPLSALFRIVQDKHPPLPQGISDSLRSFLLSCFIKDPIKRPTAEELLKHEWITEIQDRSASPNKTVSVSSSPAPSTTTTQYSNGSVLKRILQHNMGTRQSKAPSDQTSEQGTYPDRADSLSAVSRTSSAVVNTEILPADATDGEEDSYERLQRRLSEGKQKKNLVSNLHQSARSSAERTQNRLDYATHAELSTSLARKKEWRDDGHLGYKDTTSTLLASGTSSPDTRLHSPPLNSKEESVLAGIFSDRVYDFEREVHRNRTGDNWEIYDHEQLVSSEQYDPTNIRKVLLSLHPHLPLISVVPALRDLINLIRRDVEAKSIFVHTDGLLTLLELLLQFEDHNVVELTLNLANYICGDDALLLKDAAAVGLAAEIFKFAQSSYPYTIRTSAAKFLRGMSFASVKTRDCLLQCQGLKYLVVLLEDGERKSIELKELAVSCLGHILEEHGPIEGKILRMLCMADLPKRLISALSAVQRNLKPVPTGEDDIDQEPPFPSTSTASLTRKSRSSAASLSEACAPRTSSEISNCAEHQRHLSDASMSIAESNTPPEAPDAMRLEDLNRPSRDQEITEKILELLQKISESENEVHGHLFRSGTLQQFLLLLRLPSKMVTSRVVKCLAALCQKPAVVEHLKEAGAVGHLVHLLGRKDRSELTAQIQRESLIVIDTICKCSPEWKDKAVRQGIVPYLCNLSRSTIQDALKEPRTTENDVRNIAIPLLCRLLNRSNAATRQTYWEYDVANLFLELLNEDRWHQTVLEALATWLEEDTRHVEEKLVSNTSVQNLIAILRGYRYRSSNEVSAVLDPLLRMLVRSDRLSRVAGQSELAEVILNMLKEADAATCLKLLESLRRIYGMHPKPKEFINRYSVQQRLGHLAYSASDDPEKNARVLVKKQAADLLAAFQMNQIW